MRKIAVVITLLFSCTDGSKARSTLESSGFTDIEITGYEAFACGKGDTTCTGFRAMGPTGRPVRGAVGCGVGCAKGCTVRVEP